MPAKKAQPKKGADPKATWKWVYVVGALVAAVAGAFPFFGGLQPYLEWALILVGILVGIFYFDSDDVVNFGIRYLVLFAVAGALSAVPAVGPYLTGFFGGVVAFLGPVALTLLAVYFWKKYFGSM